MFNLERESKTSSKTPSRRPVESLNSNSSSVKVAAYKKSSSMLPRPSKFFNVELLVSNKN